jgi:serine kinase of HPr protein (carbohydrate metabolism regulator)
MMATIHATAVLVGERAVLITGPSGSGKSDLALRLILSPPSRPVGCAPVVRLIADDRVHLEPWAGRLLCRTPPTLSGLIEVRGQAIRRVPYEAAAVVGLVVRRETPDDRLPQFNRNQLLIEGVLVPCVAIAPRDPDPVAKLMAALVLSTYDDGLVHAALQ